MPCTRKTPSDVLKPAQAHCSKLNKHAQFDSAKKRKHINALIREDGDRFDRRSEQASPSNLQLVYEHEITVLVGLLGSEMIESITFVFSKIAIPIQASILN